MPSSTLPTPPAAVSIVLSSNRCSDRRSFQLHPGKDVTIGRASRSELKNLQASSDNALFDCPVVSRTHAELRVSGDDNTIQIVDRSSLHGTTVNGTRLNSHVPCTLESGDIIKLGERVTRGADTHDGVSLTFYRTNNDSPSTPIRPSPPTQGYYTVPSEASDMDSDADSIAFDDTSANTTPENSRNNNKSSTGSQENPIFVDSAPTRSTIIHLADDDEIEQRTTIPESVQVPEVSSPQDPDSDEESIYLHSTGLSQILNERASQIEEQDVTGGIEEDSDNDSVADADDWPANRPVSPKLVDDEPEPPRNEDKFFAYRGGLHEPARYDPVRNLQPPVDQMPNVFNFGDSARGPTSSYTYSSFGYGLPPTSATDAQTSSRWDVPPPRSSLPAGHEFNVLSKEAERIERLNGCGPPPGFPTISYGTDPSFAGRFAPPPPPPPSAPQFDTYYIPLSERPASQQKVTEPVNSPAAKGKISFIVEDDHQAMLDQAREMVDAAAPSTTRLKRKPEEEAMDPITAEPEAKKQKPAPPKIAEPVRGVHRHRKGRRAVRRLAGHAISAAFGGVGMIMFLNSDWSQSLIDWLS